MPISRSALFWGMVAGLVGCGDKPSAFYPGYVEADYVRLASPIGGTLAKLSVQRGDQVARGAPGVRARTGQRSAPRAHEAQARVAARASAPWPTCARARRPDELAVAQAQLAQAQAALRCRRRPLRASSNSRAHFFAPARLDDAARGGPARRRPACANRRRSCGWRALGARSDEIGRRRAGRQTAAAGAAGASRLAASSRRRRRRRWRRWWPTRFSARASGCPPDPVVSLLPPENIKVRFFVPETSLGALALGQHVSVRCDGCGAPIAGDASASSRRRPNSRRRVIYSSENRAKLVFMVEARPDAGRTRARCIPASRSKCDRSRRAHERASSSSTCAA